MEDVMSGKGKMTYPDGGVYEGDWKLNTRYGKGKMTYSDGSIYEGNWELDTMCGEGTMNYSDRSAYYGNWKNNKRDGQGELYYPSGNRYINYKGSFKDGKRHGIGEQTFLDGSSYKGEWVDDFSVPQSISKSDHVTILIKSKKNSSVPDNTPHLNARNQKDKIIIINEDSIFPKLDGCICRTKDNSSNQVVFFINEHGAKNGELDNEEFILKALAEFLLKIEKHNKSSDMASKVKRIKINLAACYGDKCLTTTLLPTIEQFVKNGIDVRTSAITENSTLAFIGNGKNYFNAASSTKPTIIIERLYTSGDQAQNPQWKESKYQNIEITHQTLSSQDGEMLCYKGEKHFKNVAALLADNYTLDMAHQESWIGEIAADSHYITRAKKNTAQGEKDIPVVSPENSGFSKIKPESPNLTKDK